MACLACLFAASESFKCGLSNLQNRQLNADSSLLKVSISRPSTRLSVLGSSGSDAANAKADQFDAANAKSQAKVDQFDAANAKSQAKVDQFDVVVVGAGLGGLTAGALLAHNGKKVLVCEAHDAPGGACHTWEREGFHFESGPSLYSGFSMDRSNNPLKNVFQIIGEEPEWITYDRWGTSIPEGKFAAKIGYAGFDEVLEKFGGEHAKRDWDKIMNKMVGKGGLSDAASALSSLALREDAWVIFPLLKYWRALPTVFSQGQALNEPFSKVRINVNVHAYIHEYTRTRTPVLTFTY